jgi:hypothetical protein
VSATLWVVFFSIIEWSCSPAGSSPTFARWPIFTGTVALASFASTIVCLAMQWSQRLDRSDLTKRWHDPNDPR